MKKNKKEVYKFLDSELTKGLAKIAVYYRQTYGMPIEVFKNEMRERSSQPRENFWNFYLNFKEKHPKLFIN